MEYLFPNFLSSSEEYEQSVQFWRELIASALARNKREWKDWLTTTYGDETSMRDGNPILSLLCKKRRRALSIVQYDPDEKIEFGSFVKYAFGDDLNDPDAVELLEIACKLTQENAVKAKEMISFWIKEGMSYEEMRAAAGD